MKPYLPILKAIFVAGPLILGGAYCFRQLLYRIDAHPAMGVGNATVFFLIVWGPVVIQMTLGKDLRRFRQEAEEARKVGSDRNSTG